MAIELASGRMHEVFTPGQVVEAILGFDAATTTDPQHVIWEVLNAPRPGIRLVSHMWYPGRLPEDRRLPSFPVSLILQYKRPEFLSGGAAKQWSLWRRPYYRFQRSRKQHSVLLRLARNLGSEAIVRYAAPAFHRRAELEARQAARSVVANSGYVDPTMFGRHKVWTYKEPGLAGFFNPNARPVEFEKSEALARLLTRTQSADPRSLPELMNAWRDHVARVGQVARHREPELREELVIFRSSLRNLRIQLLPETLDAIVDVASIASVMSRGHGHWFLAGSRSIPG